MVTRLTSRISSSGIGGCLPVLIAATERRRAGVLTFVLPPQPLRSEAGPTVSAQSTKIIQLQHAPARKDFNAFLWK